MNWGNMRKVKSKAIRKAVMMQYAHLPESIRKKVDPRRAYRKAKKLYKKGEYDVTKA